MYCRWRPGRLRVGEGVRCEPCGAYVDRLLASDEEMARVYGWQLVILAARRISRLYPARRAA